MAFATPSSPTTATPRDAVTQLVARAQSGDRAAESELCARFAPAIRAFARRRLGRSDAARELEQDVLLTFVEALRRGAVEDPARIGGFVLGICRNVALDRVRQRERRAALWERFGPEVEPHVSKPLERVSEDLLMLEDCLTSFSQRARDLLWLSYGESKSHAEIAAALDITEANARVLRHRTLAALKDCMAKGGTSWEAA